MNRVFRLIVISLFIIGFPLGSWYYLNKGYNYRIAIIQELDQRLGHLPDFEFTNQNGMAINQESLQKKVVINNFMDLKNSNQSKSYLDILYKIQDQFDKKDAILFYTYVKADSLSAMQKYYKQLKIKEEKQWFFLIGSDDKMEAFIKDFPLPENSSREYAGNSTVAITDTSATIRFFYDLKDIKQARKLVEHIANLMPQAPPEEARMKRELEK